MSDERTINLLGALALALSDDLQAAVEHSSSLGASGPAALAQVGIDPGIAIAPLSRLLGLTHSATVRLIDRLETEGFVTRGKGVDARAVALRLTAKGQNARRRLLAERRRSLDAALAPLTAAERRGLERAMEKMLAAVTTDRQRADHICRLCDEAVCPLETCPVERAVAAPGPSS